MQFAKFLAPLLALVASANAFKYPARVVNTNINNSPLYFTIETGTTNPLFGRNLQLLPSGNEFEAVVDQTSKVALVSLKNAAVQLKGFRGRKLSPLNLFAGLRNVRTVDGGNTTLKEVYFSKTPEHGKQHFQLFFNPKSHGRYFLTHGVAIPNGVHVVTSGFSMCPRDAAAYYQLTYIVSNGRKLVIPKGCFGAGVWVSTSSPVASCIPSPR